MRLHEVLDQQQIEELNLKKIGKGVATAGIAGALALGSPDAKGSDLDAIWDKQPFVPTQVELEQIKKIAIQVVNDYNQGNINVSGNFREINLRGTPENALFKEIKAVFQKKFSEKYMGQMDTRQRNRVNNMARMKAVTIMMKYLQDNKPDHPAIN